VSKDAVTTDVQYRLVFQPDFDLRAAAFAHEAATFERTYGVPYDFHVNEFAPYEEQSAFLVVVDDAAEVRATMRLVTPGPAGLKTLVEAARDPWSIDSYNAAEVVGVDPARTWDVATLAVGRGLGRDRLRVTAALYHGLVIAARRNGVASLLMTVDERVRTILSHHFGLMTSPLPGATLQPFEGSPASMPVYGHCDQMLQIQRRRYPEAYRLITLGNGLEGIAIPPEAEFDLLERAVAQLTGLEPLEPLETLQTLETLETV
jgi:hypothetical protein